MSWNKYAASRNILAGVLVVGSFTTAANGQSKILDAYVQEALDQNLAVRQERLAVQASDSRIAEARGQYLPSLDVQARYTWAGGGRTIDFPVGDLLNPAYGALSELLPNDGGFPTVNNEEIRFMRPREQETKLRLVQPIFQPAVIQNVRIQSALSNAAAENLATTEREVVAEVKTAYYRYLGAEKAVLILEEARELVAENVRVSRRLFENGKATIDVVYRAEAEASTVEQNLAEAETDRNLAASAFNMILNRPLDSPIQAEPIDVLLAAARFIDPLANDRRTLVERALAGREELRQLEYAADAAIANKKLAHSSYLPNLSFALDYGIQGTGYSFNSDADFRAASIVVNWNLFNGFQTRARSQRAQLQLQRIETQRARVEQQVALQVSDAQQHLGVADRSIVTAHNRLKSARQTYVLVSRRYDEGMATQIELLDARTSLTRAELNLAVTQYNLLVRYAELERFAALYHLN